MRSTEMFAISFVAHAKLFVRERHCFAEVAVITQIGVVRATACLPRRITADIRLL